MENLNELISLKNRTENQFSNNNRVADALSIEQTIREMIKGKEIIVSGRDTYPRFEIEGVRINNMFSFRKIILPESTRSTIINLGAWRLDENGRLPIESNTKRVISWSERETKFDNNNNL